MSVSEIRVKQIHVNLGLGGLFKKFLCHWKLNMYHIYLQAILFCFYRKKMFSLSHDLRGKSDKFVTGWEFGPNVKLSQRKTDDFGCGSVCRRWVSRWDGNCEVISMHYFNRQTAWTFKISPTIFRISKGLRYSSLLSFTYFNLKKT